jgi:hypothetical protein
MEHRRRTLSNVLDDDIEKQVPRRRATSASIDEQIDDYTEFVYTGSFNFCSSIFYGFLNLICPCPCSRRRRPNSTTTLENDPL